MNWPRLKRQLCLQPYLIDPYRSISYREARRIWRKEGRPDALELLDGARKKAGMTPEEWRALTGLPIKATRVPHSTALRRWAIACVFVLLASAFLACTAPGRAFAAKVYRTFTTIAENILNIRATEERDASVVEPKATSSEHERLKLSSLDEARSQVEAPLLYLADAGFILEDIDIIKSQVTGLVVLSKYSSSAGATVTIEQNWPIDGQKAEMNLLISSGEHYSFYSPSGLTFEGVYVEADQTYFGGAIQGSMLIKVFAGPVDHPDVVGSIIQNIKFCDK